MNILNISSIYSNEVIKVVVPEPCIFFRISASIAEAVPVIPNRAKTYFAKGIDNFINEPANLLNNGLKILQIELLYKYVHYKALNQLAYVIKCIS